MATYVALVRQIAVGRCRASFPDLPGCVAEAGSLDEAMALAKQALAGRIEHLLEAGELVPAPTLVDAIDRQDAILVVAVEVPDDLTTEQIDLMVPGLAFRRFDLFAERRGMTRSAFFIEAANRWIIQEAANPNTGVLHVSVPEAAEHPARYDIEAIRHELGAQDHRDALLPNDFATEDLPAPEDHTDEIKAEMMRLLEARSASADVSAPQDEKEGKETDGRKRS